MRPERARVTGHLQQVGAHRIQPVVLASCPASFEVATLIKAPTFLVELLPGGRRGGGRRTVSAAAISKSADPNPARP
jgi:hypothetical protein